MIGLPTTRLARHSIMKDRPEPLAPPSGTRVATLAGSVVARPCASIPQPSGIGAAASRALMILPMATVEVEMSMTNGRRVLAGKAIAIGLVETPATLAPS